MDYEEMGTDNILIDELEFEAYQIQLALNSGMTDVRNIGEPESFPCIVKSISDISMTVLGQTSTEMTTIHVFVYPNEATKLLRAEEIMEAYAEEAFDEELESRVEASHIEKKVLN